MSIASTSPLVFEDKNFGNKIEIQRDDELENKVKSLLSAVLPLYYPLNPVKKKIKAVPNVREQYYLNKKFFNPSSKLLLPESNANALLNSFSINNLDSKIDKFYTFLACYQRLKLEPFLSRERIDLKTAMEEILTLRGRNLILRTQYPIEMLPTLHQLLEPILAKDAFVTVKFKGTDFKSQEPLIYLSYLENFKDLFQHADSIEFDSEDDVPFYICKDFIRNGVFPIKKLNQSLVLKYFKFIKGYFDNRFAIKVIKELSNKLNFQDFFNFIGKKFDHQLADCLVKELTAQCAGLAVAKELYDIANKCLCDKLFQTKIEFKENKKVVIDFFGIPKSEELKLIQPAILECSEFNLNLHEGSSLFKLESLFKNVNGNCTALNIDLRNSSIAGFTEFCKKYGKSIVNLTLSNWTLKEFEDLKGLEKCKNIKSLNLSQSDIGDSFVTILNRCSLLESLDLNRSLISEKGLSDLKLPNLTHLNLSRCCDIEDTNWGAFAKSHPKLEHLDLSYSPIREDKFLNALKVLKKRNRENKDNWEEDLETAKGWGNEESENSNNIENSSSVGNQTELADKLGEEDENILNLWQFKSLKIGYSTPFFLKALPFLKGLESLTIAEDPQENSENFQEDDLKTIAETCKNLKELDLSNLKLKGEFLKSIAKKHALKKLTISDCHRLQPNFLLEFAEACSSIESLEVNNVPKFGIEVFKAFPGLKTLKIRELSSLTTDALVELIQLSKNSLEEISLNTQSFCITQEVLEALSECGSLKSLELGGKNNLEEEGMIRVLLHCPKLEKLVLGDTIPFLYDVEVKKLLKKRLKETNLIDYH